jgi:membrane-bound serine protease (ClpP class)
MDSPAPELQVSLKLVLPIVFAVGGIAALLARLAFLSQRRRPAVYGGGMIGTDGIALTALEPGRSGRVLIRGEIWTAIAAEPIDEGDGVRATAIDGLRLTVRRRDTVSRPATGAAATSGDGETPHGE